MSDEKRIKKCAAQHFGPWMIEPKWFTQAVAAVKAGTYRAETVRDDDTGDILYESTNGIAVISLCGPLTKAGSSFGGGSTVQTRNAVRKAANDDFVNAIVLQIDSPGGTVAGTGDLAADIAAADDKKPVYTYFEDLGCSAAYWIGSQARKVYGNPTAMIGSIGTVAVVEDTSGMMDKAGVKVHVISTGPFKGAFTDGAPVTDEQLADLQREVDELNEHFLAGVSSGRDMPMEQVRKIATGQVWLADEAKSLGLIDEVASFDAAMQAITQEVTRMTTDTFRAYAAEHSQSAEVLEIVAKGHKAGAAEGAKQERDRVCKIVEICGENHALAAQAIKAGNDVDTVQLAATAAATARADAEKSAKAQAEAIAAKDAEIAKLKEQVTFAQGTQGAVGTGAATAANTTAGGTPAKPEEPAENAPHERRKEWAKASAEWEWEHEKDRCKTFSNKANYVAFRSQELNGSLRVLAK